jgi:hypothetical protein
MALFEISASLVLIPCSYSCHASYALLVSKTAADRGFNEGFRGHDGCAPALFMRAVCDRLASLKG